MARPLHTQWLGYCGKKAPKQAQKHARPADSIDD